MKRDLIACKVNIYFRNNEINQEKNFFFLIFLIYGLKC